MSGTAEPASRGLPPLHLLLGVLVTAVWGTNFVVIHMGLERAPPIFLATMRFVLSALPAILLIPRPAVPLRRLAAAGFFLGFQFAFLFPGMRLGVSPGLASLVVQMQVFLTIAIAAALLHQPVRRAQIAALAIACGGLVVIAVEGGSSATPIGLALVLSAAASWAVSNYFAATAGRVNMVAFVVWASPFAVPPLLATSLLIEGPSAFGSALLSGDAIVWAVVAWQAYANTVFGYGSWNWLLSRHPASQVAPLALMVPIFGLASSALILGEPIEGWKLAAGALVLGGLALNQLVVRRPVAQKLPD
ncbi:EamA family transporter [Sphingomonas corticis]|uniref:EamA family transporter n=1 Tax=Sphingomonas corticis TaxID=2722791 RepID=A0ABX1CWH2_9SPHN|nr:EamA family transporter [Sphingomonas corticis]NJR80282.1 EamA family transporter [Sphingomonas corticis]